MTDEQEMITALRNHGYVVEAPTDQTTINYDKLEKRINELESQSGLMSKSWFTRAITAWLYIWGIQLIAGLVILVLGMIFGLLS